MEKWGISVKGEELKNYGEKLKVRIQELEKTIWQEAGEEFNINSPKQLGVILFEKLGLPGGKKTKTGYSTAADILDKLAPDHAIVKDILEYRQLTKLKSTYADGLGNVIGEHVFRICKIEEPIAKGIALGSASHAIGTAKAMELGEIEGAMSSLSIAVAGVLTVVGASVFAQFL